MDQARAPSAIEWRRRDESLSYGCTAKGKKERSTQVKFMVAISYQQAVVFCEEYENRLCGRGLVRKKFPLAFTLSINSKSKQDGCRLQSLNSQTTYVLSGRSLLVKKERSTWKWKLLQIKGEFVARVIKTMMEFPVEPINKTIESSLLFFVCHVRNV